MRLNKSIYKKILIDDSYFSYLDPLERMAVSENIMDLGVFLSRLRQDDGLDSNFDEQPGRMVYYAPCHQREQGTGSPYLKLLAMIPGLTVERVEGAMDC